MQLSRNDLSLQLARPRVRWLAAMGARGAVILFVAAAIAYCWYRDIPSPIVGFLIVVLGILFGEAYACDRRRSDSAPAPEDREKIWRRRETDL